MEEASEQIKNVNVFYMLPTSSEDDRDRPDVDITDRRNQGPRWEIFSEIFYRGGNVENYEEITAFVNSTNVPSYHAYGYIGCGPGFFSAVVVEALKKLVGDSIKFLPVSINGYPFFAPYVVPELEYLDLKQARTLWIIAV